MHHLDFVAVARAMAGLSRRNALLLLAGIGPGLASARLRDVGAAKARKRKRKAKKAKPNAYGCFRVGAACKTAEQCCSGICEGKKGKRQCRAHETGTCNQKTPGYCEAGNPLDTICNGNVNCACLRTTAGSNVCAQPGMDFCADCKKDADCVALGFPPGTACAPFAGDLVCTGVCESGMACTTPCGYTPPDPEPD